MKKYTALLIFALVFLGVLHVGKPLLMPLVLAIFIWYLINTLTDTLTLPLPVIGIRMPRPIAFVVALATAAGVIYFASWIIVSNLSGVATVIPAYQFGLEHKIGRLMSFIPWSEPFTISKLTASLDFNAITRVVVSEVTNIFGKGTIIAVYLLFLFLEQGSLKKKLNMLATSGSEEGRNVASIIKRINHDIRIYIGIKTAASVITALICYVIFKSVGLHFASFWAFLIFLFNYIPTIGSIVATALPSFFAFMQYESLGPFLVVLIGVTTFQMLIGNIIEPRFQGDHLNMSPLLILISLALWNMVWGIPGMFLCVPLTSIAMIIFTHFPQTRVIAIALSRRGNVSLAGQEPTTRPP